MPPGSALYHAVETRFPFETPVRVVEGRFTGREGHIVCVTAGSALICFKDGSTRTINISDIRTMRELEEIQRTAYALWQDRGCDDSFTEKNWLDAEWIVCHRLAVLRRD